MRYYCIFFYCAPVFLHITWLWFCYWKVGFSVWFFVTRCSFVWLYIKKKTKRVESRFVWMFGISLSLSSSVSPFFSSFRYYTLTHPLLPNTIKMFTSLVGGETREWCVMQLHHADSRHTPAKLLSDKHVGKTKSISLGYTSPPEMTTAFCKYR